MTASAPATRKTLANRLEGTAAFTLGPYKTAHVAHSAASQIRRAVKNGGMSWDVTVNAEKQTIRVSPVATKAPKKARASKKTASAQQIDDAAGQSD